MTPSDIGISRSVNVTVSAYCSLRGDQTFAALPLLFFVVLPVVTVAPRSTAAGEDVAAVPAWAAPVVTATGLATSASVSSPPRARRERVRGERAGTTGDLRC
jgi:hypothetical protein